MALAAVGWYIDITFMGSGGKYDTYTKRHWVEAADYDAAALVLTGLLTDYGNLSDAVIASYSIGNRFEEDALVLPGVGIYTTNRARVTWGLEGSPTKTAWTDFPAPKAAMFVGKGVAGENNMIVDTALAELLAHMARMGSAAASSITISDGEYVDRAVNGQRVSLKRNKKLV